MKRAIVVATILVLLLSSASAGSRKKKSKAPVAPEWIDGPYSVYEEKDYLCCIGEGRTTQEADMKAMEGLASIFSQNIKSDSAMNSLMQLSGDMVEKDKSKYVSIISRRVDADNLVATEIRDRFDNKNGSVWSVAVMDRAKACSVYEEEIATLEKNALQLLGHTGPVADEFSMASYGRLYKARDLLEKAETLRARMYVLDSQRASGTIGNATLAGTNSVSVGIAMRDIASQIPVYVEVKGDVDSRVAASVVKCFADKGFNGSRDHAERYAFVGTLVLEEYVPKDKKSVQCRYSVTGFLEDRISQEKMIPVSLSGKEGSTSYADASNRSLKSIEAKIVRSVDDAFAVLFLK